MHPGNDPAVAARFLGWLQGRGEPLDHLARDQARITELLAWNVDGFDRESLGLDAAERDRVLRLLALWDEFRPSLPAPRPAAGAPPPSAWLAPPPAEKVPPSSLLPSLARSHVAWAAWLRRHLREAIVLGILLAGGAWLGWRDEATAPAPTAPAARPTPALGSDLALRHAMAAALACRADAAKRLVAQRAEAVAALTTPACAEDGPCRAQREAAERALASAQHFESATAALAARVAPLPKARCDTAGRGAP